MKILRTIEELKKAQQVRKDTDVLVETAEKWEPRKKAKQPKVSKCEKCGTVIAESRELN